LRPPIQTSNHPIITIFSQPTDKNRGFAFVEFVNDDDAADALDNMDGCEIYGKVLRCNVAKALPKIEKGKAVWSAEEWIQGQGEEGEAGDEEGGGAMTLEPEPEQ
jgi:RNA recognition motif-containing protein